jgi:hypothetical protein
MKAEDVHGRVQVQVEGREYKKGHAQPVNN